MENLFEIIIPLIFAAIYFLGNFFSEKDENESPRPNRRQKDRKTGAPEHYRRVQEELRRKIIERSRARTEELQKPTPVSQSPQEVLIPSKPTYRQNPSGPTFPKAAKIAPHYETERQKRLKQIEATLQRAKELKRQASNQIKKSTDTLSESTSSGRRFGRSNSVRASLHRPTNARTAFVLAEILDRPLSQRSRSNVPGLACTHH